VTGRGNENAVTVVGKHHRPHLLKPLGNVVGIHEDQEIYPLDQQMYNGMHPSGWWSQRSISHVQRIGLIMIREVLPKVQRHVYLNISCAVKRRQDGGGRGGCQ
jgi:hypothetical protein